MQVTIGQATLVWAKGIRGISVMWYLLHDLQAEGTYHSGSLRSHRDEWLATTGDL